MLISWGRPIFLNPARQRFLLRKVVLPSVAVYLSLCLAATLNNLPGARKFRAAILISDHAFTDHDRWVSPVAFLGAYPFWTYYFNNRGMDVEWRLHAKSADLAGVIRNPAVQSIVIVGHGSLNSWQAVDKLVTNDDVAAMVQGVAPKRGEWIQLTCAVPDRWPVRLGELVMPARKVYTYHDKVNTLYFIADAISGFRLIKSGWIQALRLGKAVLRPQTVASNPRNNPRSAI